MLNVLIFKRGVIDPSEIPLLTRYRYIVLPHAMTPLRVAVPDSFHTERENLLKVNFDTAVILNGCHSQLNRFDHAAIRRERQLVLQIPTVGDGRILDTGKRINIVVDREKGTDTKKRPSLRVLEQLVMGAEIIEMQRSPKKK